jgi:hypothetical protein
MLRLTDTRGLRATQPIARRLLELAATADGRRAGRFVLGASKRNSDVERNAFPRHLELGAMVGRGGIHRSS